jgi:hypothetical protein
MGEEMPYIPYGEEGEWKKRFEMTIPILLLILVLLVVAWKMNLLVGLPIIGDLFKDPSIDIAIIGNDQTLVKTIETDIRRSLPVNTFVLTKSDLNGIRDAAGFAKYDMLILTEGQDGDTIDLEIYTLEYLRAFVDSGKPAIVIGLAGSEVTNSPQESGWAKLGFVPAVCKANPCDQTHSSYDRMTMYVRNINHPVLAEFIEPLLFQDGGQITYTMVNPSAGSSILDMEIETGEDTYTGTAIVERTGGKVIYFSFHPSTYSPLLYNSIKYLG